MDIVAVIALGTNADEEAPRLAADLGITAYEAGLLLRGQMPAIVLRSEDRARTIDLLGKLRSRGHDAVACDLAAVASSDAMFRPRSFRFEGSDLWGLVGSDERRLIDPVAIVRAMHQLANEEIVVEKERTVSLGRAAITGGLVLTRTKKTESKRVTDERSAVLYLFPSGSPPWLLHSTELRYDGLGPLMKPSKNENFDVLVSALRERLPTTAYDARLRNATPPESADVHAHLVALAIGRGARPYR